MSQEQLTERETEVLKMLADGHSVKQIGTKLNIATKTVDAHKLNLMRKLGIRHITQLVKYAIANGLTTADSWRADA